MTITHSEIVGSRRGTAADNKSTEMDYVYHVRGTNDIVAAWAYIAAKAPATVVDPVTGWTLAARDCTWDHIAHETWRFTYVYKSFEFELETGEYRITFSTTGGTAHVVAGKSHAATYVPSGANAANYNHGGLIGVTDNGEVTGVDIVIPALKFTIMYKQPKAVITDAYVRVLEALTGTYNNATFYGRAAGEVLFLGADGYQGSKTDPQIEYQFIRLPNLSGIVIGSITGISKLGHDYLWVEYQDLAGAARLTKQPAAVHVEHVYYPAAFSALAI